MHSFRSYLIIKKSSIFIFCDVFSSNIFLYLVIKSKGKTSHILWTSSGKRKSCVALEEKLFNISDFTQFHKNFKSLSVPPGLTYVYENLHIDSMCCKILKEQYVSVQAHEQIQRFYIQVHGTWKKSSIKILTDIPTLWIKKYSVGQSNQDFAQEKYKKAHFSAFHLQCF